MEYCDSKKLLRRENIRATRKKVAILDGIKNSPDPVNARELCESVSANVRIDLATVYRALSLFKEKGVIREINDSTGIQYYEIACTHNPVHPHFKCSECQKIECLRFLNCVETDYLEGFAGGCEITEISIMLSGICNQCRGLIK